MRLWTVHPRHLDRQGLTASWREALLAQKVLEGGTIAYRNHPQLERFRHHANPHAAIAAFLVATADEATRRGYRFDVAKISAEPTTSTIETTDSQLMYEWHHLRGKLALRSPETARRWAHVKRPDAHPLFTIVTGPVASWERV